MSEPSAFTNVMTIEQRRLCAKYKLKFDPPTRNQTLGLAIARVNTQPIYGIRHSPNQATCGWFIWGGEQSRDADFYQPVHVSHVSDFIPTVLKYLALEPGSGFVFDADGYEDVWYDPMLKHV